MSTPDETGSATAEAPRRPFPQGTVMLTVEEFIPNSHQRGGQRRVVAKTRSMDYEAVLKAQGAGRYRVSSIDRYGHYLAGGVITAEVSPETLTVQAVPARTPSDY